ncbi:fungal-specific transcription factor domain-containing protein [Ilyonectria destructans]|nr:fungal-specific transcription factor domain-containing protein [Ilyonectria destructans]
MWSTPEQEEEAKRKSSITCHSCRRRKVKCNRELPYCQVCVDSGQTCEYPDRHLKPGPKIGALVFGSRAHLQSGRIETVNLRRDADGDRGGQYSQGDVEQMSIPDRQTGPPSFEKTSNASTTLRDDEQCRGRRGSQLNINDLSFILHPSHEASTPEKSQSAASVVEVVATEDESLYQKACFQLGLSEQAMEKIIRIYFENMVAINLFHEPSFDENLKSITSVVQLAALLAAIAGYAIRFLPFENQSEVEKELQWATPEQRTPSAFLNEALRCIDQALGDCSDEPPPLCILQALIVTTHHQLTRGVRGRAWRSLGMCVRLAYELNLHLLDSRCINELGHDYAQCWREDEEKRRAWWAIWEMDVYASTIRRTPTGINWTQMEVLLPVSDTCWYRCRPAKSCFFEQDPTERWKALQESGNQSPKAWFIVINSLMKDAQIISCPRGVPPMGNSDQHQASNNKMGNSREHHINDVQESRQKLETLANSVHCLVRTLPDHLRYRHQYLSFHPRTPGQVDSDRQLHCSIYNIYVMIQLARLMIHRYDVFGSQMQPQQSRATRTQSKRSFAVFQDQESLELRQYFEAADNILMIVNRSCENHIQYINPFLSSTIWLAAAVQLVRKQFGGPSTKTALFKTRFDVLYLTYKQCVSFWDTQTAMQQNLESIEAQLEDHRTEYAKTANNNSTTHDDYPPSSRKQRWIPRIPDVDHTQGQNTPSPVGQENGSELFSTSTNSEVSRARTKQAQAELQGNGITMMQSRVAPVLRRPGADWDKPELELVSKQAQLSPQAVQMSPLAVLNDVKSPLAEFMDPTLNGDPHATVGENMSILDFMDMPGRDGHDMDDLDVSESINAAWGNLELPSDIHDLLSGISTY